ncbi:S-adenosyl-L-methionine-dependent methyltransferase [Marasmius fiardii PR-910]|nr:S-adenosyl-L-methionine-dependent methyltransferase [Marasmius fiardii PR-910]
MGFWKDTQIFPEACEALARKLIAAAAIKDGARVLDVGHGTGESLVLLLTNTSVPRPSSLAGITSLASHHQRSVARVECIASTAGVTPTTLYHGDAVYTPKEKPDHPLNPIGTSMFDAILALDCAYHFRSRQEFLRQSFQHLTPGGRIALADICFDGAELERPSLVRSVLRLMPKENMVSMEEYGETMKRIGYTDVRLENISDHVFPGFSGFLRKRGIGWRIFCLVMDLYVETGARFVIVSGRKQE